MLNSPAINTFLEDLITQKHGASLDANARQQIKDELMPRLEKWLILKAMDTMAQTSPTNVATFQELVQTDAAESLILTFMEKHIPDKEAFFTSTLVEFWTAYLGETGVKA